MRTLVLFFCLAAAHASAWEFSPEPICTISRAADGDSVTVTHDPRVPEYAITLKRTERWPQAPLFAITFEGPRGMTITTSRHRLSEGGRALTVTDRGFGNVLDGLQFNQTATAMTGSGALTMPLDGAAEAVKQFRACVAAPAV